ncbi:MAG: hypothetical protein JWO67_4015 [Streptosporangiaceae bacterium]|jgi:hypothetical protein|nr:hypothetical protein [Streptosporangiaceae bacterium]
MTEPKTIPELARFQAGFQQMAREMLPAIRRAMRPLVEFTQSPEGKALIADYERREQLGLLDSMQSCNCLCGVRHSSQPLCLGEVPRNEIVTVRISSVSVGAVDVPMCRPCGAAIA